MTSLPVWTWLITTSPNLMSCRSSWDWRPSCSPITGSPELLKTSHKCVLGWTRLSCRATDSNNLVSWITCHDSWSDSCVWTMSYVICLTIATMSFLGFLGLKCSTTKKWAKGRETKLKQSSHQPRTLTKFNRSRRCHPKLKATGWVKWVGWSDSRSLSWTSSWKWRRAWSRFRRLKRE